MPIYTKTGDKGETSIFGGKRVAKNNSFIEAYGSVDELNSWIGLVVSEINHQEKKRLLTYIQSDLFLLGGNLAGWKGDLSPLSTRVTEMEVDIDAMEAELPPLQSFIIPGGTHLASTLHIVRSVCRRVERQIVSLFTSRQDSGMTSHDKELILQYVNRLSDLFFVLARFINHTAGTSEIPWKGIVRDTEIK